MLKLEKINFSYKKNRQILKDISFDVKDGEMIAVLGPNGCGKSTLIKCILNIVKLNEGCISYNGIDVKKIPFKEKTKYFSYVPQYMNIAFSIPVFDFVMLGSNTNISNKKLAVDNSYQIIKKFNLEDILNENIQKISGGQRQRVFIARAFAQNSDILILDEPTSNLDLKYQKETFEILKDYIKESNRSIIISIHDLNLASRYCNRFIFLKNGKIFCDDILDKSYTKQNIESVYGLKVKILEHETQKIVTII